MQSFQVLIFALLLHVGVAEQLRADKATSRGGSDSHVLAGAVQSADALPVYHLKSDGRSLFNVFNLKSLLGDKPKSVPVRDDTAQPGRTYFNLFTSIFSVESDSPSIKEEVKPIVTTQETEPKVEIATSTLAPTVSPTVEPTSMPVTAKEVSDTAKDFLSVFPTNWMPKPEGSYSSIFLSVFAPREPPPPTVSPAPSMSAVPSSLPSAFPSAVTEGPTATVFPSFAPSLVPSSLLQTSLPSELISPPPSLAPSGSSPSPSVSPSSTGTESESPSQVVSQVPTSATTLLSDSPSLVPSSADSSADSSAAPSALSTSVNTSTQPSTSPTAGGTNPPTVTRVEGAFVTTLNLDQVPESYRQVFIAAAARWDTVIVGDLEDFTLSEADRTTAGTRCDAAKLPDVVDDVFICASLPEIDGPMGILGTAGPLLARFGEFVQTSVGYMQFDLADIEILNGNGQLAGTILHEMAHVYGIGTLWEANTLVEASATCPYRYDSKASEEYRALSGCDAAVPIETDGGAGTKCLHWDEDCFQSELMTGINTGGQELSRVTVAGLEDLGYVVDYSRATPFPANLLAPSCVCNANLIAEIPSGKRRALQTEMSEAARLNAIDYGRAQLKSNRVATMDATSNNERRSVYMGDKVIVVLYWDDEQVKSVIVRSDT